MFNQKTIKSIIASISFLCTGAILGTPSQARETLSLTTGDWAPYVIVQDGAVAAKKPGFSTEIVEMAFSGMGYRLNYTIQPFVRQIETVTAGDYLALVGTYKIEAPALAYGTEPIGMSQNCFFTARGRDWKYRQVDDFRDQRLTVVSTYVYGDEAFDGMVATKPDNVIVLTGMEADLMGRMTRLIDAGRSDVFIQDREVANYYFKTHNMTGKYRVAGCLRKVFNWLGFAPQDPRTPQLIRDFDRQVADMRASGKLQKILDRYGARDWK